MPTAQAAARADRRTDDKWEWDQYVALYRSGAVEFGLGRGGSVAWRRHEEGGQETRVFFLTQIVGRLWWTVNRYRDVVERTQVSGPWELSLCMRDTLGSILGNVGEGWAEPEHTFGQEPPQCPDEHVVIRSELSEWPDDDGAQKLVFELGSRVEDAWGSQQRRFIARAGPRIGMFDASKYG